MLETAIKVAITSVLVVAIAEVSKRSSLIGALLASLPLTSLLAIIWLWRDTGSPEKISALTTSIFWLVLPSLVFFIVLPALLDRAWAFWPSLAIATGLTIAAYFAMVRVLARFGISA